MKICRLMKNNKNGIILDKLFFENPKVDEVDRF